MVKKLVVTLMIRPQPRCFMPGSAARIICSGPSVLTDMNFPQTSGVSSSMVSRFFSPSGRILLAPKPALLTTISTCPNASDTLPTAISQSPGFATSPASPSTPLVPASWLIAAAARAAASPSISISASR